MSDNSSENSALKVDGGDINAKYSRLAAEYSKVRAQNTVLKKAIVEEQNKNSQLNEILREKDQAIRKSSQETESLNFRNSQLLRRVTVLQEEIDLQSKNGKKKMKSATDLSNGIVDNPLLEDDMKKTIIENAKLISKLNDNEEKHEEEISELTRKISALNYEIDRKSNQLQQMRMEYELTFDQMRKEYQDIKRDYVGKINKLKELEVELSTLKSAHQLYVNEVGPRLETVSYALAKKIPFCDEENAALNVLNVRYFKNPNDDAISIDLVKKYFGELVLIFYNIIHNISFELKQSGFNELKIYVKTLLKEDDGVLLNEKLNACYHLLDNIGLANYSTVSLEYAVNKFVRHFLDFCTSLHSSYFSQSSSIHDRSENSTISQFSRTLCTFKKTTFELIEKIISLPDSQQALIHEEFAKLNTALDNLISESKNVDLKRIQCNTAKVNDVRDYKSTATKYLRLLHKEKNEHIPYEEAIVNQKSLQEHMMLNNALNSELRNLEMTVAKLEEDKLRLKTECEVLLIKLNEDLPPLSSQITSDSPAEITNELGKFVTAESVNPEVLAREREIQRHMMSKLDEVIILKEEACSRARTCMLECKTLQRRLENSAVEKQLLENKFLESNQNSMELREELSTVSQNYELQLSMMSDHLANVNEKLALQSEEIDNLKYQLSNKISKKGKQK